jgi:hypothetical protein
MIMSPGPFGYLPGAIAPGVPLVACGLDPLTPTNLQTELKFFIVTRFEDGMSTPRKYIEGTEVDFNAPDYRFDSTSFQPLGDGKGSYSFCVEIKAEKLPLSSSHLNRRFRIGFGIGGASDQHLLPKGPLQRRVDRSH